MHQVTIGSHHLSPLMMTDVGSGQLIIGENQGCRSNFALNISFLYGIKSIKK